MPPVMIWNLALDQWEQFKVGHKLTDGQSGIWRVKHVNVDADNFERLSHAVQGRDPGTGNFVTLQFHDEERDMWFPMMSDTRAEILEHYEAIDIMAWPHKEIRVLIHGLGLGVVLNAALSFYHVTHVDVVELSEDVINLVGPAYTDDPRVTIHHGDAFTYRFPPGEYWNVVWYDIWPTISSANLPQMTALKRKYQNRCDWHGAWAERECRELRRQENMSGEELAVEEWRRFEERHGSSMAAQIKAFLDDQLNTATSVEVAQPEEASV